VVAVGVALAPERLEPRRPMGARTSAGGAKHAPRLLTRNRNGRATLPKEEIYARSRTAPGTGGSPLANG